MIELTPFAGLLGAAGNIYWLLALAGIATALWKGRTWQRKLGWAALVLALFVAPLVPDIYRGIDYRIRYAKAKALFDERCKTAGEKINRSVVNVEGIVWMRWRTTEADQTQFALNDPYGKDCSSEGCIQLLLKGVAESTDRKSPGEKAPHGYRFIETIDPRDGIRYRYTAIHKNVGDVSREQFTEHVKSTGSGADSSGRFLVLERKPIEQFSARFGLTWEDISTREDREHWIAGGSLKVIDLQTNNQLIGERRGYFIDTGLGSTEGHRNPWGWAKSYAPRCPSKDANTWDFVARVLVPSKQGE